MAWYIAYELQLKLRVGESLARMKSELHRYIHAVFNESNVQIMVPRNSWFAALSIQPEKSS
ncbi:hypothetical protein ACEU59_03140 [Buttiauxella noackiae]|uniref:hypothetical protein n=1 Tax=Buttiauxella noackiae TaxID=82992 RepID=UPI0035A67C4C